MSTDSIQRTGLWQTAFGSTPGDPHQSQKARLSTALLGTRQRVETVVQRIAAVLPGLTVHDVTHLDALWNTADLIAGNGYPLNALEAFVFGVAVLLHDSAMCWEAYEGGQAAVRGTVQWKDAYAAELDSPRLADDDARRAAADFIALRELHAQQAAKLTEISWPHPDNGQQIYLIDDATLRIDLGGLAGQIASSHHWDIDELSQRLAGQFNPPSGFPIDWTVDPIKIACLLRCADAAHLSQDRAPLFLYALVKRAGVSQQHWMAQNRIMGPSPDTGDPSRIIYTSSRDFSESDAPAWWIAFDAIGLIDREIRDSNLLLRARSRAIAPSFGVTGVRGAGSVAELAKYVKVNGWEPHFAQPHVSNVEALVKSLGGETLYGPSRGKLDVVLRELIQNARDAVVARRNIEGGYVGEICVRLDIDGQAKQWLVVEDDGVGMSRRVLTGPLLDFGQSFWKSALVQAEFPGLRSSNFKSIGKFGIGFYSVFMAGDRVDIASRPWHMGLSDLVTLTFNAGASLRPIVKQGRQASFPSAASTQVRICLKDDAEFDSDGLKEFSANFSNAEKMKISLDDMVAGIAVGLDVRIVGANRLEIHGGNPGTAPSSAKILEAVSLAGRQMQSPQDYIQANHHRMRPLIENGKMLGVAALSTIPGIGESLLSLQTIGGLATSLSERHMGGSTIGFMNFHARSARRDASGYEAQPELLKSWVDEQMELLEAENRPDMERCAAGFYAFDFGGDPIDFGRLLVGMSASNLFMTYAQAAELSRTTPFIFVKSRGLDVCDSYGPPYTIEGAAVYRAVSHGRGHGLALEGGKPSEPLTVAACLDRAVRRLGDTPTWTLQTNGAIEFVVLRSQSATASGGSSPSA